MVANVALLVTILSIVLLDLCSAQANGCVDDKKLKFTLKKKKKVKTVNCKWVGKKADKRCGKKDNKTKIKFKVSCPAACDECPAVVDDNPPIIIEEDEKGCCSLDYKTCVDWCGETFDSCSSCDNAEVVWLPTGSKEGTNCVERWSGCTDTSDCCGGLECRFQNYFGCFPPEGGVNPVFPVSPSPPIDGPVTVPQEPTPSPPPPVNDIPFDAPPFDGELLSTNRAMNAWDVFLGLDLPTTKNSLNPPKFAFVASGGAAGNGEFVVSEAQAYGLLITGTILASWDTHAGIVPNSNRDTVLTYFEGYFNFWKEMCKNSSSNPNTNCQTNGKYCKDDSANESYVCLPDWKHKKGGGSEATGPAPDGDEDAIVGIMLAVKAVENESPKPDWYDEARKWADASATAFFEFEVDGTKPDFRLVKLGSCWGGWDGQGNNPSYHSPGSYRVMKDYQASFPDSDRIGYDGVSSSEWDKLIDTSYAVLRATQCVNDGALVPNWATVGVDENSGTIIHKGLSFSGSGTPQYEYGSEGARTTFRVALDASFYPDQSNDWSPYLSPFNYRLNNNYRGQEGEFDGRPFSDNAFPNCFGSNTNTAINMFDSWQFNSFIYGPTFSSLIVASSSSEYPNANEMIDAVGDKLSETLPDDYYPRSWSLISNLMLNGAMESAGKTLKGRN